MSDDKDHSGFSADQARMLDDVLDDIIPRSPDGRLPGAGELDLAGAIDEFLRKTPELRAMILESLSALDALARRRHDRGFTALSTPDKLAVKTELANGEHAFPPVLMIHTFAAYYQHPRVLAALGLESRPPHPQGYVMEPNDLSLLDPVRQRRTLYRDC